MLWGVLADAGVGQGITITVSVDDRLAEVLSPDRASLSYAPPVIVALTLSRSAQRGHMDCSAVGDDGLSTVAPGNATVTIDGANFGNGTALSVTIHDRVCDVTSATNTRILCVTVVCEGASRACAVVMSRT